jgi:hypothetical protein
MIELRIKASSIQKYSVRISPESRLNNKPDCFTHIKKTPMAHLRVACFFCIPLIQFPKGGFMNWLLLTLSILLSACSSLPVALQKAPAVDVQLTDVIKNISSYRNMPVRWGGTVIEVENEEHLTNIQLLYFPLNGDGSLRLNAPNQGRFAIQSPEFLDPALYVKGSEITVAGIASI